MATKFIRPGGKTRRKVCNWGRYTKQNSGKIRLGHPCSLKVHIIIYASTLVDNGSIHVQVGQDQSVTNRTYAGKSTLASIFPDFQHCNLY